MTGQAARNQAAQASEPDRARLPSELLDLLDQRSLCILATVMPNGSPQQTVVWVGRDGNDILVNTVQGSQKAKNIARDKRVSVTIHDPGNPVDLLGGPGTRNRHDHGRRLRAHRHPLPEVPGLPVPWIRRRP